jgi:GNAT superfamily N-acetyltransferase
MSVDVVPATIHHWDRLRALFTASAGVSGCWCMWPLCPPKTFRPDERKNKAAMKGLLDAGFSPGLIALDTERPVGWCALGPRERYPQYEKGQDDSVVWAVPCIYLARQGDRDGVARALLETAVQMARANAAAMLEGPPPWWSPGDDLAVAEAIDTFLKNGFRQTGPGARIPTLTRTLS